MKRGLIQKLFGKKASDDDAANSNKQGKKELFDIDLIFKKEFVHLESAYQNQEYVFRRATETNRLTLGELLESILKIGKTSVLSMALAYRNGEFDASMTENVINSPESIWNYDIFSSILKNKTDEEHYTNGMFHETTLIVKTNVKNCIIVLTSLGGIDTIKYMRVSILSPDNSIEDDGRSLKTQNAPLIASFILSYCETENNADLQTYLLVEESVKTKQNKGQELTELELEYIHGQFEFQGYYYVGYGKWLFEQNRYYDAFSILERAFNYMKTLLIDYNTQQMEIFYDVCNTIGVCLSKMDREDEACFYFRQGFQGLTLKEANKLAMSHAKLGNPVALNQMTDWLKLVAQKYGDNQNWSEEVKQFSVDVPVELTRYKEKIDAEIASMPIFNENITIGYVLLTLWGLDKKNLAPCMFVYDIINNSFLERIEDVDAIFNFILNTKEASNKVYILSCSHVHYRTKDVEDKSILCHNAPIVISTHDIKGTECTSTIRLDMIRQNFSNNDDNRDFVRPNIPLNVTCTIGIPYGVTYTAKKESLLAGIRDGVQLIDEKRFIEAYKLSKWIFECVSNKLKDNTGLRFESKDELLWGIFFESSYNVGYCLMELGKPHTAAYYLEISSHSMNCNHIQEYINCLTNSRDPQALEVVEDVIKHSPQPDSEENVEEWNYHVAFLKRRKAYILIDMRRYDEARQLLFEMLEDPLCEDFAQGELNYLSSIV